MESLTLQNQYFVHINMMTLSLEALKLCGYVSKTAYLVNSDILKSLKEQIVGII